MTQSTGRRADLLFPVLVWLLFSPTGRAVCVAQDSAYSDIHGTIALTGRTPERRRVMGLERYPGHGGHSISAPGTASRGAELRLSERAVVYLEGDNLNQR